MSENKPQKLLVSVVIPFYNEGDNVCQLLENLALLREKLNLEIIFVDDGSTDRTQSRIKGKPYVRLISHLKNYGKGAAIRTGLRHCTGEILVIQDADLEYPVENIPKIIEPIVQNRADVVFGSRFLGRKQGMKPLHVIGNKALSLTTSLLFGVWISDVMTGHKAFKMSAFKMLKLEQNGFCIEVEIAAKLLISHFGIFNEPISYRVRQHGKSKITLRHGIECLARLLAERLSSSNAKVH
jgi:glycosyltransferase involved in cell wall biosynthesis